MKEVDVAYDDYGRVRVIRGASGIFVTGAAGLRHGDSAQTALEELRDVLMMSGNESFTVRHVAPAIDGGYAIFIDVAIDNIPVFDGGVNIRVTKTGEIDLIGSKFVRGAGVARMTARSGVMAKTDLLKAMEGIQRAPRSEVSFRAEPVLRLWTNNGDEANPVPVWAMDTNFVSPDGEVQGVRFYVDAGTGVIRSAHQTRFGLNRQMYTFDNTLDEIWPLWSEGNPNPADVQAYSIYTKVLEPIQTWASTGLGQHYEGMVLAAHWGNTYNSYWDYWPNSTYPLLAFGDCMAMESDAIAHEYGHGIYVPMMASTQPAGFSFWNEWFAANEFWADSSAAFDEIRRQGINPWKITSLVLRDYSQPKLVNTDFRDWYWERKFAGRTSDVAYKNSTIFGHALYLLVHGGYHSRAGASARGGPIPYILVQPTTSSVAHAIFGFALVDIAITGDSMNAYRLKAATMQTATALGGPTLAQNVENAWLAVGVGYGCSTPPLTPIPQIDSWFCKGKYTITWPQIPSVTYHSMVRPLNQSYDYAGITVTDGPVGTCSPDVPARSYFRMRACNACGCSPWTIEEFLEFYKPCCR